MVLFAFTHNLPDLSPFYLLNPRTLLLFVIVNKKNLTAQKMDNAK